MTDQEEAVAILLDVENSLDEAIQGLAAFMKYHAGTVAYKGVSKQFSKLKDIRLALMTEAVKLP